MYLNKRSHESNDDESLNNNTRVISYESQRQLQRNNRLKALHLKHFNRTFWHQLLENESGSLLEPPSSQMNSCKGACHFCLSTIKEHAMPVNLLGLSKFLACTFVNASGDDLSPLNVVNCCTIFQV